VIERVRWDLEIDRRVKKCDDLVVLGRRCKMWWCVEGLGEKGKKA